MWEIMRQETQGRVLSVTPESQFVSSGAPKCRHYIKEDGSLVTKGEEKSRDQETLVKPLQCIAHTLSDGMWWDQHWRPPCPINCRKWEKKTPRICLVHTHSLVTTVPCSTHPTLWPRLPSLHSLTVTVAYHTTCALKACIRASTKPQVNCSVKSWVGDPLCPP